MSGADGGRGEQTPFRIEPEVGKIPADTIEPSESNKSGDVLHEHESRSHLSHDPGNVRPQPSLIIDTEAAPGCGERLTVETGSDEIHSATPRATVEAGDVIPDRRRIQGRLFHPCHESGRRVGVPLNTSHGSYVVGSEGKLESELEPSVAVEETEGAYSHVTTSPGSVRVSWLQHYTIIDTVSNRRWSRASV